MEQFHSNILTSFRSHIIQDLNVYNAILEPLTTQGVLQRQDIDKINAGQTYEDRAEILLDTLPSCGPNAFDAFHLALRKHYHWLSDGIDQMLRNKPNEILELGRTSPGSPNLLPLSPMDDVIRKEKMEQLKAGLKNLLPGGYLVLHGMKGFGKSRLTANVLKDPTLSKSLFNNEVYTIKFGCTTEIENEISIQLNHLYHLVEAADIMTTRMNSNLLKKHLILWLKNHFVTHSNALLILDDVWHKTIIDDFDFHCKTLVITTDIDLLEEKHRTVIEMNDGFTEAESLGLFASALGVHAAMLPLEAKQIHYECTGMPILISMFAAQFSEFKHEMNHSRNRWKYYLNSLRTKNANNRVIKKFLAKLEDVFNLCIDRLKDELRSKYQDLAIFSEDVNIMPETLKILWNESNTYHVAEHMQDFCHKSLAVMHWNISLKSYVYGVHELLLSHIRQTLGNEKLKELHKSFIEKYRNYCDGDFSKLPDDNYSFSYIGHHLEQSGLHSEFPKLYFDFDFIREKIYHTGLSDLLIDLKKYRKYITGNTREGMAKVEHLETFLETHAGIIADHRQRNCLDLIQIAINHSSTGFVREKAMELATARTSKLYVTHDHASLTYHTSEEVSTDVTTAFFTDDPDKILIGNRSGKVVLWNCVTRSQTVFTGHSANTAILKIDVATNGEFFLTLCQEGIVKLFVLKEEEDGQNASPPLRSPRDKQRNWNKLFSDTASFDNSQYTFSIDNEIISDMVVGHDDKRIAVCTRSGSIKVWSTSGETLYTAKNNTYSFERITFTGESTMLHVIDNDGVVLFYEADRINPGSYCYRSMINLELKKHKVIFFSSVPENENSLIIVADVKAIYLKWEKNSDPKYGGLPHGYKKQERAHVEDNETFFVCANVTYDGEYLIIADSKGYVNVWHIHGGITVTTFKGRVNSLDTYSLEGYHHLICGSGNRVIHRWDLLVDELPKNVGKPLFDAVMKPWGEEDIIAKESPGRAITINRGNEILAQAELSTGTRIVHLSINSEGDKILYVTDTGVITLFDVERKVSTKLLSTNIATLGIVEFIDADDFTGVACGINNDLKLIAGIAKVCSLVQETGRVISIHHIDKKHSITVGRNGLISFWRVYNMDWERVMTLQPFDENESLSYSCLSPGKEFLAVLTTTGQMSVYRINKADAESLADAEDEPIAAYFSDPTKIKEEDVVLRFCFKTKLTCCAFSSDDNYLAVGVQNNDISIWDMSSREVLGWLKFHCNAVSQLHWSPISIQSPILLSVNSDELAWWNITPLIAEKKEFRRSRRGMRRSSSSPGFIAPSNNRMTVSQSADSKLSNDLNGSTMMRNGRASHDGSAFWKNKTAKHENRKALLAVVPLPPNCNSKVCVSSDITKILTVDVHGCVKNFKLFNYM